MARARRWTITTTLLAAGLILAFPRIARADDDLADATVFERRWVASMWTGAPAGIGYGVARSIGVDWQVRATIGTPMLLTGVGGTVDVVRGVRMAGLTLWYGVTAAGYASDNCSWGGCGDYVAYAGMGPQVGVGGSVAFLGRTRLFADLGVGLAAAPWRTDNLSRYQPLGGLRLGVGW